MFVFPFWSQYKVTELLSLFLMGYRLYRKLLCQVDIHWQIKYNIRLQCFNKSSTLLPVMVK
jgi:hypothetical protein